MKIDIFCSEAKEGQAVSAWNAPHKYKLAKRTDSTFCEPILKVWNSDKRSVLQVFLNKIKDGFGIEEKFVFAFAPTSDDTFISDLKSMMKSTFTNAVDASDCFKKKAGFFAGLQSTLLTEMELQSCFYSDQKNLQQILLGDGIKRILFVDDVFSLGNTFRGMKFEISKLCNHFEITTAVLVKVTQKLNEPNV